MNEGDVALASLAQADGLEKLRPVVLLRKLPPFGDWLVCGMSSQLQQQVNGFDESISPADTDFSRSGLKGASLIRLGFLIALPARQISGAIGSISRERHGRLLQRLSDHLSKNASQASP